MKLTHNPSTNLTPSAVKARLIDLGVALPVVALPAGERNHDIWIGPEGRCAAVPTDAALANGCKSSGFGGPDYLVGYIIREGVARARTVDAVILAALGLKITNEGETK